MNTVEIQQWLATDPEIQKFVADRIGLNPDGTWDEESDDPDDQISSEIKSWAQKAKIPKNWVRQSKMKIDSPTWKQNSVLSAKDIMDICKVDVSGGIARVFWLRDTDHISILTVEKNGKIVYTEDYSD